MMSTQINEPWLLIIEDFNQIYCESEKFSATGITSNQCQFHACLAYSQLSILTQQGPNFTWSNNKKGKI